MEAVFLHLLTLQNGHQEQGIFRQQGTEKGRLHRPASLCALLGNDAVPPLPLCQELQGENFLPTAAPGTVTWESNNELLPSLTGSGKC